MQAVYELSHKYIELPEYKKHSCVNINTFVPLLKVSKAEEEEGLSDQKLEQIKINKRKRRRYTNSFFNADNLVIGVDQGPTLMFFENREKNHQQTQLSKLVKPESMSNINNWSGEKGKQGGFNRGSLQH